VKKIATNGGGGSSCKKLSKGRRGAIKTILMGNIIVDTVFFHSTCEFVPNKESGYFGKPRTPVDPKSEVVINIKEKAEIRKNKTNFFLEIFIYVV
jgi:hypothetical protein